jgi:[ribosomal protein S18]-alanine N-acetyltransferase
VTREGAPAGGALATIDAQAGKEATVSSGQFQKQAVSVQIRWMIRRDMPEVLRIENESFEFNWTEDDFLACLRQRNCIGMVAEHDNRVVGFMIYELHKTKLHILNFAVAPACRRLAVGAQMIEKLINKLSQQRRQEIVLEVRETNLTAQLFYQSQGFRAVNVLRGHYADSAEDAYVMQYRLDADIPEPGTLVNRIAQY